MASRSTFEVRLGLLAGGAAALLLTFGSAPAWAQAVLYTVAGTSVDDLFGYAAVGVGDTDFDGVPDLLVGAPQITPAGAEGYLIVLGGPAGAPRFLLSGGVPEGEFGRAVTGLGDVTGEVEAVVRQAAGPLAEGVELFDRFVGGAIAQGSSSLAFHVVYRAGDRTLTDAEVDAAHANVVKEVGERFGATLR